MDKQAMAETLIPVLEPGKAAAFDRWMAQGGGLIDSSGRARGSRREIYRQGPQKGMTYDQARQKFESMWGSASPAIRAKYEARATVPATKPERRESAKDMYARQRDTRMRDQAYRMGGKEGLRAYDERKANTSARKPFDQDGNGVPDMIQRVPTAASKPPTMSFEQLTDPKQKFEAVGDGSSAATGWKPTIGEDGKPLGNNILNPAIGNASLSPVVGDASNNPKPGDMVGASTGTPGPARRGGTSVSGQKGRISSGASPSAPVAVRNQVAANAGVKPVMPDQVAAPAATPTVAKKPLGATPAGMELTGMKGGVPQYTPIEEVYGERALTKPPMLPKSDNDIRADYQNRNQTPMMRNGADNAMRSQGMVVQSPVAKPVVGPARMAETPRSDGYVARDPITAGRLQAENVRNDTTGAPRAVPVQSPMGSPIYGRPTVAAPTTILQKPAQFAAPRPQTTQFGNITKPAWRPRR